MATLSLLAVHNKFVHVSQNRKLKMLQKFHFFSPPFSMSHFLLHTSHFSHLHTFTHNVYKNVLLFLSMSHFPLHASHFSHFFTSRSLQLFFLEMKAAVLVKKVSPFKLAVSTVVTVYFHRFIVNYLCQHQKDYI